MSASDLPLSAAHLLGHMGAWSGFGREVVAVQEQLLDERAALAGTSFSGTAADGAFRALATAAEGYRRPAETIAGIVDALRITAELQHRLDTAVAAVITVADRLTDRSPAVLTVLNSLRAMGQVLDLACARHIDALCADSLPPSAESWRDFPGEDVDVIHEYLLLTAPEHVVELARQHADLRVLETPAGGLVAAVGDVAEAESVTTFVAGVSSSDPAGWSRQIDHARALSEAAGGAGVVWLGYAAPPDVPAGLDPRPAAAGGAALAQFQRELARRYPDQHRVVVGHSYGSVVTGAAASHENGGLAADDLVVIGSPGMGVNHVSDLVLDSDDPQVHAATAAGDPISLTTAPLTGVHGPDPTARRFGAEVWELEGFGDHSSYFPGEETKETPRPGDTEFLREFTRVIAERRGA
ncbi:alpha/beta hydrolase [Corynebacterium sp.]|uniref:alpha/beta hydrolase n=1 Tax=Corynebacterium sp. TaxID=1720 RepID=UPI0037367C49